MIYFMQSLAGGAVKIGYTDNLQARHQQLEKHYGVSLAILATVEGGPETETEIHGRFRHLRLKGKGRAGRRPEQFRPTADLMAFIGRPLLVGVNPDAVEVMEPAKEKGTRSIRLDLSPRIHRMLRVIAATEGMSMAAYARKIIEERCYDEMERRGFKA